jgi:hypothetical protein
MKVKKIILILIILIMFSCQNNYREYIPIVLSGDELVEVPKMMTEKHRENIIHVLKYYGENWKMENGKLFIAGKIDREILWNYTTKANDSKWLVEHRIN